MQQAHRIGNRWAEQLRINGIGPPMRCKIQPQRRPHSFFVSAVMLKIPPIANTRLVIGYGKTTRQRQSNHRQTTTQYRKKLHKNFSTQIFQFYFSGGRSEPKGNSKLFFVIPITTIVRNRLIFSLLKNIVRVRFS